MDEIKMNLLKAVLPSALVELMSWMEMEVAKAVAASSKLPAKSKMLSTKLEGSRMVL